MLIFGVIGFPAAREYYEYISNPKVKRLGRNAWLFIGIIVRMRLIIDDRSINGNKIFICNEHTKWKANDKRWPIQHKSIYTEMLVCIYQPIIIMVFVNIICKT